MPLYDFSCTHCDHSWEAKAAMREVVAICPACNGPADRKFSVNSQVFIPIAFRATSTKNWALPPSNSPKWAGMAKEGVSRDQTRKTSLREFCRQEGVRGA